MNPQPDAWQRLVAAARRAPAPDDAAAPYGFAARVAAQAMTREPARAWAATGLALSAMSLACLLAVGTMAANYSSIAGLFRDDAPAAAAADDPVGQVIDGAP